MVVQTDAPVRPICIGRHGGLIGELSPKLKQISRNLPKNPKNSIFGDLSIFGMVGIVFTSSFHWVLHKMLQNVYYSHKTQFQNHACSLNDT